MVAEGLVGEDEGVDAGAGAGTATEREKDQRKGQGVVVLNKRRSGQLDRSFIW